jgi:septal ring factor EnvC (AmiA/AmiB activator)
LTKQEHIEHLEEVRDVLRSIGTFAAIAAERIVMALIEDIRAMPTVEDFEERIADQEIQRLSQELGQAFNERAELASQLKSTRHAAERRDISIRRLKRAVRKLRACVKHDLRHFLNAPRSASIDVHINVPPIRNENQIAD